MQNNPSALVLFFLIFFLSSSIYGDTFKCVDKQGNTVFQDSHCGDEKKETIIPIKKYAASNQCIDKCNSARTLCVADLGLGERNTSRDLLLCDQAKKTCDAICYSPNRKSELQELFNIERSSYERELRQKKSQKDDHEYLVFREKRAAVRENKRKQQHCEKYEKKLAKIQSRWVRKQQSGWKPKDEEYYLRKIENAKDDVKIECQQ